MSLASGPTRTQAYAVAWRSRDRAVATGELTLERSALVLRGTDEAGAVRQERLSLELVAAVRIGRAETERIRGERSMVLELRDGTVVAVAPIGAAGAVFELADLVAELSSEEHAAGAQVAVVVPLRAGTAARARELVATGPPFDVEHTELDAHHVFVSEREVVFVFEGEHAREVVERLIREPQVLRTAVRWRECLGGRPRLAEAVYAWRRSNDPFI